MEAGPSAYIAATIGRSGQRRPGETGDQRRPREGADDIAGCGARRRQIDPAHPALDRTPRDAPFPARMR